VCPQVPQLFLSAFALTQVSLPASEPPPVQSNSPVAHAHIRSLQIAPVPHALPHPPQFCGFVDVLTQSGGVPHASVFGGQAHEPLTQIMPPVQATPQVPQLPELVCRFTQAPVQAVRSSEPHIVVQPPVEQT